jgi:hypothetical protein
MFWIYQVAWQRQVGIATCCEFIRHCLVTGYTKLAKVSEGDSIDWEPVG